jgi:hypothetical protein
MTLDHGGELTPRTGTLLSLDEYKTLRQITDTNEVRDAQLELALDIADNAIEEETGRDFLSAPTTLTRKYRYNGSGVLDIDDASSITAVSLDGWDLDTDLDVIAGPKRGPMFWWLEFAFDGPLPNESRGVMGFTRNLDTRGANRYFTFVEVTGTFGWADADIPKSVKQAAAWLVDEYATEAGEGAGNEGRVTAEHIADLGYSYDIEPESASEGEMSARVRSMLAPFTKTEI